VDSGKNDDAYQPPYNRQWFCGWIHGRQNAVVSHWPAAWLRHRASVRTQRIKLSWFVFNEESLI
jgi:hypothetical protein